MMKDNEMLYCLIAFIIGWLVARQMGNGFSVGGQACMYDASKCSYGGQSYFKNKSMANDCLAIGDKNSCNSYTTYCSGGPYNPGNENICYWCENCPKPTA